MLSQKILRNWIVKNYGARKKLDAARISASLIFGSSERRILYISASISLNLRASFKMSDTVYARFSGGSSGCPQRTPPRTSIVKVRRLKQHHVPWARKLRSLQGSIASFRIFFDLHTLRQAAATMMSNQDDYLPRPTL